MATRAKIKIVGGTRRQRADYRFFEKRLPTLLADKMLAGKFVVISNKKEHGFFDTFEAAVKSALDSFAFGQFIVQEIIDPNRIVNILSPAL